MTKLLGFLAAALTSLALTAPAQADVTSIVAEFQRAAMIQAQFTQIEWKVGDKASYKIAGGIINGTMDSFVREDTGTALWLQQDANLGFMGKQKIETLLNKADGQILKMLVNGQEQTPPDASDMEVVEMKEDRITVSAGEFDAIYVKLKSKKDGKFQEAWVNPREIPMSGLLKAISDSPFGKINNELTSFSFANR